VSGFAGGHLAEMLLAQGSVELYGTSRRGAWPAAWRHLSGRVELLRCDLCDLAAAREVIEKVNPKRIFHLAGYAHAGQSFQEPDTAWAVNLTATRHLYDAVARWGGAPRILYVGSGLVYGDAEVPGQALDECCPLRPASPYAASKAAADLASYQYTRSPGLDIVRARPFNHIGPAQSPQFAVANFARQIAAIERDQQPPLLETGNLSPLRDLTDVRDIVRAYLLLMEQGQTGEVYNIASGEAYSMQAVLERLLSFAQVKVQVRRQEHLVRATETAAVRGNYTKIRNATGWAPRLSLEQSLADTLAYWRSAVG
jgi:GDP-4-dehydro-6-deoxy-D-mannose reductase